MRDVNTSGIDRLARVTATEASWLLADLTRSGVVRLVERYEVPKVGMRGRSPLYRWGDLMDAERRARATGKSTRHRSRRRTGLILASP